MNFLSKLGLTKLVNNIKNELNNKQDKLTTGNGIEITDENVIKTTSSLKGKKITVIGDSLSTGYTESTNWVNVLAENTGANVVNLASNGATIAYRDNDDGNNFYSMMSSVATDSDFVIIMGGGNDMLQEITAEIFGLIFNLYSDIIMVIIYKEVQIMKIGFIGCGNMATAIRRTV